MFLENENVADFSHQHVYTVSVPYPIPNRAIDPGYYQAILLGRETLFPSGMLYVTNIRSGNRNITSFCSELNREHADIFTSLRFIFLGHGLAKLKDH